MKEKVNTSKVNLLIIAIAWFALYFVYGSMTQYILNMIGLTDTTIIMFVADLLFFLGIILYYRNDIRDGAKHFSEDYTWIQKIKVIALGVLSILVLVMVGGMVSSILFPNLDINDENTNALYSLADISTIAVIFKTLVFASIAEELLYKKTLRDVIDKDWLFIVVSSLIYALMNVIYAQLSLATTVDFVRCFLFSTLLSWIYVRHKNNTVIIMLIKFIYTFIPLMVLLSGLGA